MPLIKVNLILTTNSSCCVNSHACSLKELVSDQGQYAKSESGFLKAGPPYFQHDYVEIEREATGNPALTPDQ
jgi:hypothetical protein